MKDRPVVHPQFLTFTKLRKFCFLLLKGSVWGTIPDPPPLKRISIPAGMLDPPLINTLVLSPLSITLESASIEFLQGFTNNKIPKCLVNCPPWGPIHSSKSTNDPAFPRRGRQPQKGEQTYYLANSPENCIKIKKIVPPLH